MKKLICKFLCIITICFSVLMSTSCFGELEKTGVNGPLVDAGKMDWGFVSDKTITDMSQITIENSTQPVRFEVYQEYYFIIQYTISPRENNDGQLEIDMKVKFPNVDNVVGDLFQTNAPKQNFIADKNPDGSDSLTYSVTFKVPKDAGNTQKIKAVFKIKTKNVVQDNNYIQSYLSSDNATIVTVDGSAGLTLLMIIDSIKIQAPVISYNEERGELTIKHVEHADRYVLYVGGLEYKLDGKTVTISGVKSNGTEYEVGENIYFALDSVLMGGEHRVKVRAVTTDDQARVRDSDYSAEIIVNIC